MRDGGEKQAWKVTALTDEGVTVYASPDPKHIFVSSPSVLAFPSGRLVAVVDLVGPGVRKLPGDKGQLASSRHWVQGKIFVSRDEGQSWAFKGDFPFCQARLFLHGNTLYLLGHCGTVMIMRSSDGGESWGKPAALTRESEPGICTMQCRGNILESDGRVYLAIMVQTDTAARGSANSSAAPVVMRADVSSNLMNAGSWSFSQPVTPFRDLVPFGRLDYGGLPFFNVKSADQDSDVGGGRWAGRMGWGDPVLQRITDPDHAWHDAKGITLHLLARAYTHRSNFAGLARIREDASGAMELSLQSTPARKNVAFLPIPGGHLRFDVLHDDVSGLYWLLSAQTTDSMIRPKRLPKERIGLPCDESARLQLHFSRNLVDWCFAGLVCVSDAEGESLSCGGMAIGGNDLSVLTAVGAGGSNSPDDAVRIVHQRIADFRDLAY